MYFCTKDIEFLLIFGVSEDGFVLANSTEPGGMPPRLF